MRNVHLYGSKHSFGFLFRTRRNAGVQIRANESDARWSEITTIHLYQAIKDSKSLGLSTIVRREGVEKKRVCLYSSISEGSRNAVLTRTWLVFRVRVPPPSVVQCCTVRIWPHWYHYGETPVTSLVPTSSSLRYQCHRRFPIMIRLYKAIVVIYEWPVWLRCNCP